MTPFKILFRSIVLAGVAAFSVGAFAQATDMTDGEVRKIDKETKKITLKHAEIKSLDMPPMTMAFHVKDAKMLDGLAVGDKLRFQAERIDGKYTVTSISKVP